MLFTVLVKFVGHRKIIVRIDRAITGGQVPDMTIGRQHLEIVSQVTIDGRRFGRRFYDEKFYDSILMIKVKKNLCDKFAVYLRD
jgi:hypothetical protein